ncbi:TonB-dependent siderophore receptor PiuA [soil metagenome]
MLSLASVMLATTATTATAQTAQQAPQGAGALPTIDVQESARTGGDGYQATQSTIARSPVPLLNTPQSITVIPQQILQEQNTTSYVEALRNVAGITFRAGEGGNGGDNPYIRGFDARNDIYRDGVRDPGWYTRDTFATQQIEVLKGPSSFLFGRGSTGGVINATTKTPEKRTFVDTEVSAQAPGGWRATLDANGQLNENVAARIAVMGQDLPKAGREDIESKRWGVAPSLRVDVNDQTKVTASYIYQHTDQVPDFGIPFVGPTTTTRFPAQVPRGNIYGVLTPSLPDTELNDAHIATLKVEHDINDQWKITNTSRYSNVDRFLRINQPPSGTAVSPGNLNVSVARNRWQVDVHNDLWANQTDVVGKFQTWGLLHTLATGVEFSGENRTQVRQTISGLSNFNLLYPDPYPVNPGTITPALLPAANADGRSAAIYAADQIKINRWFEVMGGVRFENYRASSNAQASATVPLPPTYVRTDDMWSYRVGGIFHPTENSSLYVMHGTSFNPSAEFLTLSANNANLAPEENETTEVGFKADVIGGRLSLATAIFRTDKTNMRVPDPTNPTLVNILGGKARVQGFEASAQGRITDQWEIMASYTYLDSAIISSSNTATAVKVGNELIQTPNNAFSLWTTYKITPEFTIGGGAYYTAAMWGDTNNTSRIPDWWRLDAMASYRLTPNATLQLNVYNLLDTYYFDSAYTNWAVPAPGRSAMLSLRTKF